MDREDVVRMHNGISLGHYKECNNAICSNMDGPRDYHNKWSMLKIDIIWYHLYVESKKMTQMNLLTKTAVDSQTKKRNLCLPKGKEQGGLNWELGIKIYMLLYIE